MIREAFLRGISARQVGRVVATLTGEAVSAQTVSKLTRDLDEAVREFHQARLNDDYAYLFLDGVSLRVRRPTGRKQVQMLVAHGIRRDGRPASKAAATTSRRPSLAAKAFRKRLSNGEDAIRDRARPRQCHREDRFLPGRIQ